MSRDDRLKATFNDFILFFVYYFGHYIDYRFAKFHYDMASDLHDLVEGKIKELAWIQYRESAKTSFAKAFIVYLICFRLDEYINVDSYDKENSERILFDVVWELQTNKRILDDFGQLYNAPRSRDQVSQKRVNNFITNAPEGTTGIRVEAHSTQEPVRGRIHGSKRPGVVVVDDFENKKTIKSEEYTKNIREHIQEFKGGLDSTRGRVLYLGNYLSEFANVQSIIERSKVDPLLRIRMVPIEDEDGLTWTEKYVRTDAEVKENMISVESIRRRMWTIENQDDDFMAEMMCRPIDYANSKFKKEWFEQNRYMTPDLEGKALNTFIMFDNAPSTKDGTDWIGCTVISVDPEDVWYLRYAKRYKMNTPNLVEEIFRLYNTFKPIKIGVEQNAFDDLIKPYLDKRAKELKVYPIVEELKHNKRRKEDRIQGALEGRFKLGMIKLLAFATDDTNELVKELVTFPKSRWDDLSDSLSYGNDIAFAPGEIQTKLPVTMSEHIIEHIKKVSERRTNPYESYDWDTI